MFCSPASTKEDRKGHDRGDHILLGNLFPHSMTYFGYRSLLETLLLKPKKKHLKKVIAHMLKYEEKPEAHLVRLIVNACIIQKLPIVLGNAMKDLLQKEI